MGSHWPDPQKQSISVQKVYQEFIAVNSWGPDLDNQKYSRMYMNAKIHTCSSF